MSINTANDNATTFCLEVWGDYACFTRPELKVERMSYPVMTPSAARAMFDAVYLEFDKTTKRPAMRWQPTSIEILAPIRYIALMRNEVKEKISTASVKKWMKRPEDCEPLYADAPGDAKGRTQRQTMALANVRYRIHARAMLYHEDRQLRVKVESSFERRARAGQCVWQPYLGCREFVAYFELVDSAGADPASAQFTPQLTPQPIDAELGYMVYDTFDLSAPNSNHASASISLFRARVRQGVLVVPPYLSDAVLKPSTAGGGR
jgi:CRISPR-associated protein Cas5d